MIEKLTRLVIESIHGLPYEDAIKKEEKIYKDFMFNYDKAAEESVAYYRIYPITIGRVIQAIKNKERETPKPDLCFGNEPYDRTSDDIIEFKKYDPNDPSILNYYNRIFCKEDGIEDGRECTIEDQSQETIEKLIEALLKRGK